MENRVKPDSRSRHYTTTLLSSSSIVHFCGIFTPGIMMSIFTKYSCFASDQSFNFLWSAKDFYMTNFHLTIFCCKRIWPTMIKHNRFPYDKIPPNNILLPHYSAVNKFGQLIKHNKFPHDKIPPNNFLLQQNLANK